MNLAEKLTPRLLLRTGLAILAIAITATIVSIAAQDWLSATTCAISSLAIAIALLPIWAER